KSPLCCKVLKTQAKCSPSLHSTRSSSPPRQTRPWSRSFWRIICPLSRPIDSHSRRTLAVTIRTLHNAGALAAGLVSTLCLAVPAQAQRTATVNFVCSIEGAPAQLTAQVEAVNEAGVRIDPSGLFGGSIATGNVNYFYQGALTSATSRYSFTGTNQFADFVDLIANERFRVQMIPQGTQLLLIINPQGPGPVRYMCQRGGESATQQPGYPAP